MITRKLIALIRRQEGATALEFALIAPVLVLFIVGIIEVSMMLMARNLMESALFVSSRTAKTGFVQDGITQEDTIMAALNERAGVFLDTNQIVLTNLVYSEFGDIGQPEPFVDANFNGIRDEGENFVDVNGNGVWDADMGGAGLGEGGSLVVFTATYPWQMMTPMMALFVEGGVVELTARTVVRNEPF